MNLALNTYQYAMMKRHDHTNHSDYMALLTINLNCILQHFNFLLQTSLEIAYHTLGGVACILLTKELA